MTSTRALSLGLLASLGLVGCGDNAAPQCSDVPGTACTVAGIPGVLEHSPDGLSRADTAFYFVSDVEFAPDGTMWLIDWNSHQYRRLTAAGTFETVIGTDYEGDGDAALAERTATGAKGTDVALNHPTDIDFMPDGKVLLTVWHNNKLRTYDPVTGLVHVVAGETYGYNDGPGIGSLFDQPTGSVVLADGTIFTNDQKNQLIRRIAPDADHTVSTFAGGGPQHLHGVAAIGFTGDGGPASAATFHWDPGPTPLPSGGLALSPDQHALYVADSLNHRIRKIDLVGSDHLITTVAGTGEAGYAGDGGDPLAAQLNDPMELRFGPDGRLYVVDCKNAVVRAIDFAAGTITTVAGTGATGLLDHDENLPATAVELNQPYGLTFDAAGDLYIADTYNSRVLKVSL